jgi:hypothetical protein
VWPDWSLRGRPLAGPLSHPSKKASSPGLGVQQIPRPNLTRETSDKITPEHMVKLLEDMFQDTSSWPTDEQVRSDHIVVERDLVRRPGQYNFSYFLEILCLFCLNAGLGQLYLSCSRLRW